MEICNYEKCTGCSACENICPKECISMVYNEYGDIYPEINEKVCIKCKQCINICPVNIKEVFNYPIKCYASWSIDEKDRNSSSSGGVASVFSQTVIEKHGAVYGAEYDNGFAMKRECTAEGILKFKGSKYVFCKTGNTYSQAKKDLDDFKEVLYIGTPCQIAGLKAFLKKDYEKLITVDLICHGTPSEELLNTYIKEKTGEMNIQNITFREGEEWKLKVYNKNSCIMDIHSYNCLYFKSFIDKLTYRNSCYTCKYAGNKRVADITIGDFWGIGNKEPVNYHTDKVSVVLINTLKGKQFLNENKEKLFLEERQILEAINGNAQLREPSNPHEDREKFKRVYVKKGFCKAVLTTTIGKNIIKNRIKQKILSLIPKKIKRVVNKKYKAL